MIKLFYKATTGEGYVDYIHFGDNGKPLAVVPTSHQAHFLYQQGEQCTSCKKCALLEREIYMLNRRR